MSSNSTPPPPTAPCSLLTLELGERRRPGRPRAVKRAPDEHERARHGRLRERLEQFVKNDVVVSATAPPVDRASTASLDAAMLAVAQESSALLWDRIRAQAESRPGSEKLASRRTDALARLAALVFERARLGNQDDLDPRDPRMQRLVGYFFSSAREVAVHVLGPEVGNRFIDDVMVCAEGWEDRVDTPPPDGPR